MRRILTLIALIGLTGCASRQWRNIKPVFNCIDYANAYTRQLKEKGYECGTADYTKDCGVPHRIAWLRNKEGSYIYVEPYFQQEADITRTERITLRNHRRRGIFEEGVFGGSKTIEELLE